MQKEHLLELRDKELTYWWHTNKRRLVFKSLAKWNLLSSRILEIGSGGGLLSAMLHHAGADVVASDLHMEACGFARDSGVHKVLVFDASRHWPLKPSSFQTVLVLDVLEHFQDDVAFLTEVRRVLSPGGIGLINVPAYQFIFSTWDKALGHFRRYSKSSLIRVIKAAGLQIRTISYWNMLSLIPAIIIRGRDRFRQSTTLKAEFPWIPSYVNEGLKQWGRLELSAISTMSLPFGLSLFAVVELS